MSKLIASGLKYEQLESATGRAPCDAGRRELALINFLKPRLIGMQKYIANGYLSHNCSVD